jgi:hypothetical protein
MGVRSKVHALADLTHGKECRIPTGQQADKPHGLYAVTKKNCFLISRIEPQPIRSLFTALTGMFRLTMTKIIIMIMNNFLLTKKIIIILIYHHNYYHHHHQ